MIKENMKTNHPSHEKESSELGTALLGLTVAAPIAAAVKLSQTFRKPAAAESEESDLTLCEKASAYLVISVIFAIEAAGNLSERLKRSTDKPEEKKRPDHVIRAPDPDA